MEKSENPRTKKSGYVKIGGNGGKRRGSGRKAFVPTDTERKQVEAMIGCGLPMVHISALMRDGISEDTLRKYFQKELLIGKAKASLKIGQTIFQKALGGDVTSLIWWSKTQMGWREKETETTPADTYAAALKAFAEKLKP